MTLDELRRLDAGGMYDAIRQFPRQWREGRAHADRADLGGLRAGSLRPVLVAGMGGSAIGGDLLRALALESAPAPVVVSRSYRLPAWVGAETMVVVSSYSGDTEETLAAMDEALRRRATVVCVATGGQVLDRAQREGLPFIQMPGGLQPRAALGYSLTALLVLAERIGLLDPGEAAWQEAEALLEERAAALANPAGNPALDLATALRDRLPWIYSGEGLMEPVNLRWRTQLQENSKTLAAGNVFPELNHNEIMGWQQPSDLHKRLAVVVLRDRGDHPRVQRRIATTRALLEARAGCWIEVESRGTHPLARLLSLVHLGDWVSFYLAVVRGVEPTPIPLIDLLKERLAEG